MHMFNVNYYSLFASAVIQWIIGALWYGAVFKKSWTAMVGPGDGSKSRAAFAMVCSFIASLVLCFVLVHIMMYAGTTAFIGGAALSILCWLGFMAPPMFAQHIYEHRPANLFAINAGYWIVAMAISGGVLAAWR